MRIEHQSKSLNSRSRVRVLSVFYKDIPRKSSFGKDSLSSTSPNVHAYPRVLEAVEEALIEKVDETEKLILLKEALTKKMSFSGTKVQVKPSFKDGTFDKLELILKCG